MYDIFSLKDFTFPKNFLFGSATAGHQIEGNNIHSHRWEAEMKGTLVEPNGNSYALPEKSGMACNGYEMFREDSRMIAELGHKAYRFSIEWCRIEPEKNTHDEVALRHYIEQLELLKSLGIKTCVTLCHMSFPIWFHNEGGFFKKENLIYFQRYLEYLVPKISHLTDMWIVLNEQFIAHQDYKKYTWNSIRAHGLGYHIIKQYSQSPVSSAHMGTLFFPYRYFDEADNLATRLQDWNQHGVLLHAIKNGELVSPGTDSESCPEVKNTMDFWALNIYTRALINSRNASYYAPRFSHKKLRLIDSDFGHDEMYPEGLTAVLERFSDRPVIVTENGCCCNNDDFRIVYLALYLSALHDAIKNGVDARGYFYWSLIDNYEWGSFRPRFGLVDYDKLTFERHPKPSAWFYRDIIRENGFSQKILRKYLKEMPRCESDNEISQ